MEEDSEMDLDSPIKDFSSILYAIKNIQQGKVCCLLVINWERRGEGRREMKEENQRAERRRTWTIQN
jgi:hypothetical protein